MTPTCRSVDQERAECPNCRKRLMLRTLAYKHAPFCKGFEDRVKQRTQKAFEKYLRNIAFAKNSDEKEHKRDEDTSNMNFSDENSENSIGETSLGASMAENSENSDNSEEGTFGRTPPTQFPDKTPQATFEATQAGLMLDKTPRVTFGGNKTQGVTPRVTSGGEKTLRVTHGRTLHPELDNKITGMFQYLHMLS